MCLNGKETLSIEYIIGVPQIQAIKTTWITYSKSLKYTVTAETKKENPRQRIVSIIIIKGRNISWNEKPTPDTIKKNAITMNDNNILTNLANTSDITNTSLGKYIFFTISEL